MKVYRGYSYAPRKLAPFLKQGRTWQYHPYSPGFAVIKDAEFRVSCYVLWLQRAFETKECIVELEFLQKFKKWPKSLLCES